MTGSGLPGDPVSVPTAYNALCRDYGVHRGPESRRCAGRDYWMERTLTSTGAALRGHSFRSPPTRQSHVSSKEYNKNGGF